MGNRERADMNLSKGPEAVFFSELGQMQRGKGTNMRLLAGADSGAAHMQAIWEMSA